MKREVDHAFNILRPFAVVAFRDVNLRDDLKALAGGELDQFLTHAPGGADNCDLHNSK